MSDTELNNQRHFPRIEEILSRRASIVDKPNPLLPGVRRHFTVQLNADDMAYFSSALLLPHPDLSVRLFAGMHKSVINQHHTRGLEPEALAVGEVLKGNLPVKADNPATAFIQLMAEYIDAKTGVVVFEGYDMTKMDMTQGGTVLMTPQPYSPPNIGKVTTLIKDLQKNVRQDRPKD